MSREFRGVLLVVLALLVGVLGYRIVFHMGKGEDFKIQSVVGDVRHVSPTGATAPAQAGEQLVRGDRIVSGDGGEAVLRLGTEATVTVNASTSVEVVSIDDEGVRLELEGGKVRATIRPGGRGLTVGAGERSITTRDADFTAVRAPDGTLAVSAERGLVDLAGIEGVAQIGAGAELVAPEGRPPLQASATDALLLQVAWPAPPRTREREVEVRGTTQPGARVRVRGGAKPVETTAGSDGTFRVKVELSEGTNRLSVDAVSLLGRQAEVDADLVRDTTAPQVGVTLEF